MELVSLEKKKNNKRTTVAFIGFGFGTILIMIAIAVLLQGDPVSLEQTFAPSITLTTPPPLNPDFRGDIVIDVTVNEIPEGEYPAASISVNFNNQMLEFVGLRQGDMVTRGSSENYNNPIWDVDIDASNQHGVVNAMYLDTTGGQYPYLIDDANILLRLVFRLKDDGVQEGVVHHIIIDDAVLATIDPLDSVGVLNGNLKAHHAQIIIR